MLETAQDLLHMLYRDSDHAPKFLQQAQNPILRGTTT